MKRIGMRTIGKLALLVLLAMLIAVPAQAKKMKMIPKVDNILFFQDYSGSMAMGHKTYASKKIAMSKNLLYALNEKLPALGYNVGVYTFAPFAEMAAVAPYDQAAVAAGIGKIATKYSVFQRKTPMGYGIMDLRPVLDTLSGKTAIIMLSDGVHNEGIDPIEQARAIYASYPNVCFHIISFADDKYGQSILDAIAALSDCSCPMYDGTRMLANGTAVEDFIKCVGYDLIAACEGDMISFRTIHFDLAKWNIRDDMVPLLEEAVTIINDNECCYLIEGHTCSLGSIPYNQRLSEKRAQSVYDWLIANGANSACKLQTIGYGELRPAHDNSTEASRKLNRRVEIRVVGD